jgi:hypothetical protein
VTKKALTADLWAEILEIELRYPTLNPYDVWSEFQRSLGHDPYDTNWDFMPKWFPTALREKRDQSRNPSSTYSPDSKYHQIIPEVKSIRVDGLRVRDMHEVRTVSPEVASRMDYTEPVGVSLFADGSLVINDGHHRVAAAKQTGREYLPVILQAINARGRDIQHLIMEAAPAQRNPSYGGINQAKFLQDYKSLKSGSPYLRVAKALELQIPNLHYHEAETTASVYISAPGWAKEVRVSNHSKYGANKPTHINGWSSQKQLTERVDRAVRAAQEGMDSYAKVAAISQPNPRASRLDLRPGLRLLTHPIKLDTREVMALGELNRRFQNGDIQVYAGVIRDKVAYTVQDKQLVTGVEFVLCIDRQRNTYLAAPTEWVLAVTTMTATAIDRGMIPEPPEDVAPPPKYKKSAFSGRRSS